MNHHKRYGPHLVFRWLPDCSLSYSLHKHVSYTIKDLFGTIRSPSHRSLRCSRFSYSRRKPPHEPENLVVDEIMICTSDSMMEGRRRRRRHRRCCPLIVWRNTHITSDEGNQIV